MLVEFLAYEDGVATMKARNRMLMLFSILLPILVILNGCSTMRHRLYDAKQYFLTDIMRW